MSQAVFSADAETDLLDKIRDSMRQHFDLPAKSAKDPNSPPQSASIAERLAWPTS